MNLEMELFQVGPFILSRVLTQHFGLWQALRAQRQVATGFNRQFQLAADAEPGMSSDLLVIGTSAKNGQWISYRTNSEAIASENITLLLQLVEKANALELPPEAEAKKSIFRKVI